MTENGTNRFEPDYAPAPGEILLEWLQGAGVRQAELATRLGMSRKTINQVVRGTAPVTPETAIHLEKVTGVPARLWNNLEASFRGFLARKKEDGELRAATSWLARFSYGRIAARGWVPETRNRVSRVRNLLHFFGVASFAQWERAWGELDGTARGSRAYRSDMGDLSAWLRQGEIVATGIKCEPFNGEAFRRVLGEIRLLTAATAEEQNVKVPALCATAGVAFVLLEELPRTHVNGFTRWLTPTKAVMQVSLRHKRDDQLWFTFFHEAAHLLLHGKKERFLELQSGRGSREAEADKWAAAFLVAPREWERFWGDYEREPTDAVVRDFATLQGIAPGIIAGRVQRQTGDYLRHARLIRRLRINTG